jgi:cytochrome c oxidase subunit 2
MFYVCSIVFVLVMIAVLLALKHRAAEHQLTAPVLTRSVKQERMMRDVVVAASIVTVAILFVFLIVSFSVGRSLTAEMDKKNALTIQITGHQWWWEVRYWDVDASNIFTTANEIHIPIEVPVTFDLRSTDVIHSFWVPNLAGKKDLIPGKAAAIWLQADKLGVYRGQCAEYCGLQHAQMALWIVVETQDEFNAWRQKQTQTAVMPSTDLARRGQQVFLSSSCVMCHAINGTPAGSNVGPNLTHLASRSIIAGASLLNTRENLRQWITNSQVIKPGNKMPANTLSNENLEALLDYLQSLK